MVDAKDQTTPTPKDVAAQEQQKTIDWKAESRKWEQRAKDNKSAADAYSALKTKFDDLSKSKDDAATKLAQAQKTIADLEATQKLAALKAKVSKTTGVPVDLLTGSDEDSLTKQAKGIADWTAKQSQPKAPDVKTDGQIPHGTVSRNGWARVGKFLSDNANI